MPGRHNAAGEAAKESGDKPPSVSFFSPGKEFTALRNAVPVAFRILVPRNPPCSQAPGRCVEGVLQGRGGPSALQVDIRNDPVIHHSRHGPHQRRHDHRSEDRPHAHSPEGREPVPRRQAGESRDQEDRGQVVRHRLLRGRGGGAVRQRDPCRRGHECRPGCGCDVCGRGRDHPRPRYRRSRYENRAQPAQACTPTQGIEAPHEDETPLAAAATQAGQQAQELAAPDQPKDRGQGRHRVCREPEHGGHDALCQGDCR